MNISSTINKNLRNYRTAIYDIENKSSLRLAIERDMSTRFMVSKTCDEIYDHILMNLKKHDVGYPYVYVESYNGYQSEFLDPDDTESMQNLLKFIKEDIEESNYEDMTHDDTFDMYSKELELGTLFYVSESGSFDIITKFSIDDSEYGYEVFEIIMSSVLELTKITKEDLQKDSMLRTFLLNLFAEMILSRTTDADYSSEYSSEDTDQSIINIMEVLDDVYLNNIIEYYNEYQDAKIIYLTIKFTYRFLGIEVDS